MSDLAQRLRNGADRLLKWAHKQQYSGPPVISIPVHEDNIDRLMAEAANLIEWQAAEIAKLRSALSTAREEGRLEGLGQVERAIVSSINGMKAETDETGGKASPADEAYIEGQEDALSAIRALKEKQG